MSSPRQGASGLPRSSARNIAGACALGFAVTWHVTSIGAVAQPVADHYGIALAAVGLFATVLFLAELVAMVPAGRLMDRIGPWHVGMLALLFTTAGNALGLLVDGVVPALAFRALVGVGVGTGFIAGAAYVQSVSGTALAQGVYGGVSLSAGGLAVAVVPALHNALDWRGPLITGTVVSLIGIAAFAPAARPTGARHAGGASSYGTLLFDRRLLRFAAVHASSFGLAIVLSNWVVTVLERRGNLGVETAGVIGGLILVMGVVGRPLGGLLSHRRPGSARSVLLVAIAAGTIGTLLIGLGRPPVLPVIGASLVGLAAGLPFALVLAGVARIYPREPGTAFGAVNSYAQMTIIIGTPLLGLGFSLPGDGLVGFAVVALLWALTALVLPRAKLLEPGGQPQPGLEVAPASSI